MKKCPFCETPMKLGQPHDMLIALGIDMKGTLGGMLEKALSNPKGKVYKCPACHYVAIFA